MLSVLGVAIGTAALVVVLSVFNGLEQMIIGLFGTFDANIKISRAEGKMFQLQDFPMQKVQNLPFVVCITEVIEDNVLLKYEEKQLVVKLKGVSENYDQQYPIDSAVKKGSHQLVRHGRARALVGEGIQFKMGIDIKNGFSPLELWYPKSNLKPGADPTKAFNTAKLPAGGIFAIEKQYDDHYIFAPLSFAEELLEAQEKRSSLELKVQSVSLEDAKLRLQEVLGENYKVETSREQHASLFKAIHIEKLFAYITFTFILAISSLNIFFSLSMMAVEKQQNLQTLFCMGATRQTIRNIFIWIGWMMAGIGTVSGLAIGFFLCWGQDTFHWVSMGMQTSLVQSYPVEMYFSDFVATAVTIALITFVASLRPALLAAKNVY